MKVISTGERQRKEKRDDQTIFFEDSFLAFNYGLNRMKQLPVATIRRRPATSNHYEPIHLNNRWYTRR